VNQASPLLQSVNAFSPDELPKTLLPTNRRRKGGKANVCDMHQSHIGQFIQIKTHDGVMEIRNVYSI